MNVNQGLEFYKDLVVGNTGVYIPNTVREFTWEFWVMPYTTSALFPQSCTARLSAIASANALMLGMGYHPYSGGMIISLGTNTISIFAHSSGFFLHSLLSHDTVFPSDRYTHVVITADQTVGFSLFINGAFVKNGCGPLASPYWIASEIQYIGGELANGAATPRSFSGKVAEMGYWPRKLTATEIDTLYCSGTATGASAIWNMRGTTEAAILADSGSLGYQLWKQTTTGTVGLAFSETFEVGMRILYSNPNIKYSVVAPVDNRARFTATGVVVSRVGYYMQYTRGGTLWWVYVSMPSFVTPANNYNALQIPDGNYWNFHQRDVAGLVVMSNHPSVGNYSGARGRVEIYGCCASATSSFGDGSSTVYDHDDTLHQGCSASCGHGGFTIHNMDTKKTIFSWVGWHYTVGIAAGVGIGNNDNSNQHYTNTAGSSHCGYADNPDWSCSANAGLVTNFKLDILVGNPPPSPSPSPTSSSTPSSSASATNTRTPTTSVSPSPSCIASYAATVSYNCAAYPGYTLSGTKCQYSYGASSVYNCNQGGSLSGTNCWIGAKRSWCHLGGSYDPNTDMCTLVQEPITYVDSPSSPCPAGYTAQCCTFMGAYACCQYWMNPGYDLFSGCRGEYYGGWQCPGGWTHDGGSQCYSAAGFSGYNCPSGGTLSGSTCTITYDATVVYSCPQGGSLSGTSCITSCVSTPSPSPSSSASSIPTRTTTPSVTPTTSASITPSPSYIHTCGVVRVPDASCSFTDTQATCRCNDGLYSETGTPEFTLTCNSTWQWPPVGNCYKCNDLGNPFYSTRIGTTNTQGYLTSITHQCVPGFWNSLDQKENVTARCQTNGVWSPFIECSQCRIPVSMTNTSAQARTPIARIRKRSDYTINGFSPATEINVWCNQLFALTTTNPSLGYPQVATCSQATGRWNITSQCISCRMISTRRRCTNMRYCTNPCSYGPWSLPPDLYDVSLFA
jgi:hypothetical protein